MGVPLVTVFGADHPPGALGGGPQGRAIITDKGSELPAIPR